MEPLRSWSWVRLPQGECQRVALVAVLALWTACSGASEAPATPETTAGTTSSSTKAERAQAASDLHRDAILVDTHNDVLQRVLMEGVDLRERLPRGHSDLPRFAEGGVDVQFFSLWPDPIYGSDHAARRTLQQIDAMYRVIDSAPDHVELATTAAEARRIVATGKIAALMGIEGGHAIEDDLSLLRIYHRLGVRYMTLTHFNTNNWADSSGDESRWEGLAPFGEEVVREMNRIGMIVDISHVSDETFWDVMQITTKPVIASHSSCRALCDHPRNLSDDMIRAVADNGGVVGINFYSEFVDPEYKQRAEVERGGSVMEEFRVPAERDPEKLDELARLRHLSFSEHVSSIPRPPFESVIDHIEHIVQLVGTDHVGLGSDFDGINSAPQGLDDVTDYPRITEALLEQGYSSQDVKKILGENFLRVLKEVTGS